MAFCSPTAPALLSEDGLIGSKTSFSRARVHEVTGLQLWMAESREEKAERKRYGQWHCNGDVMGQRAATLGGEHSITYKLVRSLSCTTDTNVALCVKYTQTNKKCKYYKKNINSAMMDDRIEPLSNKGLVCWASRQWLKCPLLSTGSLKLSNFFSF